MSIQKLCAGSDEHVGGGGGGGCSDDRGREKGRFNKIILSSLSVLQTCSIRLVFNIDFAVFSFCNKKIEKYQLTSLKTNIEECFILVFYFC